MKTVNKRDFSHNTAKLLAQHEDLLIVGREDKFLLINLKQKEITKLDEELDRLDPNNENLIYSKLFL